jgi:hypothetical protein
MKCWCFCFLTIISRHSKTFVWRPHSSVSQCDHDCNIAGYNRYWGNVHIHYGRNTCQKHTACDKAINDKLTQRKPGYVDTPLQHNYFWPLHCFDWTHCAKIANCIFNWHLCPVQSGRCKVVFTKNYCNVMYNNKVILRGTKDPSTDLWTLLLNPLEYMLSLEGKVGKSYNPPPVIWTTLKCGVHTFGTGASKCS